MRVAMQRRLAPRLAALAAGALLVPMAVAPSLADELASAPTVFAGTAYLPDGSTVAPATVIDFSLAGGAVPFARTVADVDGTFSLDFPEEEEVVTAALAGGGRVDVTWLASKLYQDDTPDSGGVLDTAARLPEFAQQSGGQVAWLLDETGGLVDYGQGWVWYAEGVIANALGETKTVHFVLPDTPGTDPLITAVANTLTAAGIYQDPDMLRGLDDLDDPDLVPPLGVELDILTPVEDAAALATAATVPDHIGPGTGTGEVVGGLPSGESTLLYPEKGGGGSTSCGKDPKTYWWDRKHDNIPRGTITRVFLDTYSCTADNDDDRDEVGYRWEGYTRGIDDGQGKYKIWRLKFRSEAESDSDYDRKHPDPSSDVSPDSDGLTWTAGFDYVATFTISGTFKFPAKKIHPWYYDSDGKLYHVSWLSDKKNGSWDGDNGFNNGGGFVWDVPEGANGRTPVVNQLYIWRCWDSNKTTAQDGYKKSWCDPNR